MNAPKSRIPVLLVLLALTIALAVWVRWSSEKARQTEITLPIQQPVVQVVSQEPAPVPQLAEKAYEEKFTQTKSEAAQQSLEPVATPVPERYYVVREGDVMTARFGKAAVAVCELNKLKNCNRIYPGQRLLLPPGVKAGTYVVRVRTVRNPSCITLGVAPWNPEHQLDRMLEGINQLTKLSPEKKAIAKQKVTAGEKVSENELTGRTVFREMLYQSKVFGQAKHVYDKPVCTPEEGGKPEVMDTYDLGDGIYLAIPRRCGNPAVYVKPVEPPVVEPPVTMEKTPDEPATPGESAPPVVEEESPCPIDPKLVVGQENEPTHDGNNANSFFASGAVYCTWRGEEGTHGAGVGFQASQWDGLVNHGAGKFTGHLATIGPAYEYISDKGWDVEAKLLFGNLIEKFKQDDYQSERHFNVGGVSGAYNNYQREMAGEKALAKTQVFASVFWPLSHDAEHSWQGNKIADTTELRKFNFYVNAGVRQELYNFGPFKLYTDLGYFLEDPTSESMSWRVGITDPNSICGIGIGIDHDLKHGGDANAWGWWCDIVKGVKVVRRQHRMSQVIVEDPEANIDVY